MLTIFKKEYTLFFSSAIGYLALGVFLMINGLLLWVLENPFNILNAGYADLTAFFTLCPWIFILLIPALTMHSFSDEVNFGTLEILKTKPIGSWKIVLEKYAAALFLVCCALLPTLFYIYSIYNLSNPVGNIDLASIIGAYLGLLFIGSAYCAIGLFTSSLFSNQIAAFISGVVLSVILYYGFHTLADMLKISAFRIENIGLHAHYESISRGVIDSRDLLYFLGVTIFFLVATKKIHIFQV